MKKRLKILIPIIAGLFFIYLTYVLTSPEERTLIFSYVGSAKIEFVLLAMLLGASADVIRGLRWQLLSRSLGYETKKLISVASVFMCYTSNMAIARSGEFVRASVLSNYNNIPIGKILGTIAVERIIDVCISLSILISVWIFQYNLIAESIFNDEMLLYINNNIGVIGFIILSFLIVLIFLIRKIKKLRRFFNTILEGLLSITKLKGKVILFVILSLMIWICYILAFSVIKFSVPELSVIDSYLIFPAFVVGVFSISLSNHGLGVYPLAISLFLVNFGINTELGLTYGWLAWSCQAIITLIFGALSFFVLPLLNASD